jgi:hypothetical protein
MKQMVLTESQSPKKPPSSTAFRLAGAFTTTNDQRPHVYIKVVGGFVISFYS